MVRTMVVSFLAVLFAAAALAQPEDTDPYSISLVATALRLRAGGQQVILASNQKYLARLGDGVSVALLKILSEEDLAKTSTVRALLPVIRDSFDQRQFISIEADKQPKVTLFLLSYLRQRIDDPQTQHDIEQTVRYVQEKTKE
jgi:hypothetical protein